MDCVVKLILIWVLFVCLTLTESTTAHMKLQGLNNRSELAGKRSKRSADLKLRTTIHITVSFPTELLGIRIAIAPSPFNLRPDLTTAPPLISTEPLSTPSLEPEPESKLLTEPESKFLTEPAADLTTAPPLISTEPLPSPSLEPEPESKFLTEPAAEPELPEVVTLSKSVLPDEPEAKIVIEANIKLDDDQEKPATAPPNDATTVYMVNPNYRLHEMLEDHVHINISAEKLNFHKVKPAEVVTVEDEPEEIITDFEELLEETLEELETEEEKEASENESEIPAEPETPTKHPAAKQPLVIKNVSIKITPSTQSIQSKEVFLELKEGKAYKIQRGGCVLASVLYPKVVILTAEQTADGHLTLEFFRTPDFGLNKGKWQIIIDKLGEDEESVRKPINYEKGAIDKWEIDEEDDDLGHVDQEVYDQALEIIGTIDKWEVDEEDNDLGHVDQEVYDQALGIIEELDEVEETQTGIRTTQGLHTSSREERRRGPAVMQSSRVKRSVDVPQAELTLSSLHKDPTTFPRIVGEFNRLPRTFTVGNGGEGNPPLDPNCTYGVYTRVMLETGGTVIHLQSGLTRFSNGTVFSAHVGDKVPGWYDKTKDRLNNYKDAVMDTMGAGWDRVNQLPSAVLYGLILSIGLIIIIKLVSMIRRRMAREAQVDKQISYYSNMGNCDSKPLLADSDEESPSPGPSRQPLPRRPVPFHEDSEEEVFSRRPLPVIPVRKNSYEAVPQIESDDWLMGPEG